MGKNCYLHAADRQVTKGVPYIAKMSEQEREERGGNGNCDGRVSSNRQKKF